MKKMIAILLMLTLCAPCALAQDAAPATKITVQGSASVTGAADIVVITANASAVDETMLGAQEQISSIIENTTAALMSLGVLAEDIVTTSYSYYARYDYGSGAEPALVGYEADHTLEITCRSIGLLDSMISAVTSGGMTEIYNISYDVSGRAELYNQALAQAIHAAESKAVHMAAAGGRTIIGLESLTEKETYDARNALMSKAAADEAGFAAGIRTGGVSVSASVTAVYQAN